MAGCGSCGKPRPGPTGRPKASAGKATPMTTMSSQSMSFQLKMDTGEQHTVRGSLLEAQAKLKRLGGRGSIET